MGRSFWTTREPFGSGARHELKLSVVIDSKVWLKFGTYSVPRWNVKTRRGNSLVFMIIEKRALAFYMCGSFFPDCLEEMCFFLCDSEGSFPSSLDTGYGTISIKSKEALSPHHLLYAKTCCLQSEPGQLLWSTVKLLISQGHRLVRKRIPSWEAHFRQAAFEQPQLEKIKATQGSLARLWDEPMRLS